MKQSNACGVKGTILITLFQQQWIMMNDKNVYRITRPEVEESYIAKLL